MKKTKKIILSMSTIFMSLCLMIFGVFAALQQSIVINGQIDVNINSGPNARMAVVASSKTTEESAFTEYGSKSSYVSSITLTAPISNFNEDVYYMVHSFEFTNYGSEIENFTLTIAALDETLEDNFNCFIGEDEKTVENPGYSYTSASPFIGAYSEDTGAPTKTIYVYIELKEEVTVNEFTCNYTITIQYEAAAI